MAEILRPRFIWNWTCWGTWYFWQPRCNSSPGGITVGITSFGPLGIYWERRYGR